MIVGRTHPWRQIALATVVPLITFSAAIAQTTSFTYQGSLTQGGNPANGNYDLQFALFDNLAGGTQIGSTSTRPATAVSGGVFTVQLDFGVNAFPGADRFLEIGVRAAGAGSFTTLAPRQQISSTPYAIRTLRATTADALTSACVGCVQDSQINSVGGTKITGQISVTNVPSGSGSYIQNGTTQQAGANFNISGNGTAGTLNVNGPMTMAGVAAPAVAPAGQARVFFNSATNKLRVSENGGAYADLIGGGITGSGTPNTLPLWSAGTTLGNSAVSQSGANIGIGTAIPQTKLTVQSDFYGIAHTDGVVTLSTFLNANGGWLGTTSNHALNFFTNDGGQQMTLNTNGNFGIGTTSPAFKLDVVGPVRTSGVAANDVIAETRAGTNSWARMVVRTPEQEWALGTSRNYNGNQIYLSDDTSGQARMTIQPAGGAIAFPLGNMGIGTSSPAAKLHIVSDTANAADNTATFTAGGIGGNPSHIHWGTTGDWYIRSALPAGKVALQDTGGTVAIGGTVTIGGNVGIGAVTSPLDSLHTGGFIRTNFAVGNRDMCADSSNRIGVCSSSLRYKTNVQPLAAGLDVVRRLRPISFTWKEDGMPGLGLAAEEVERVDPSLTFRNDKGEVEGVKYNELSALFINVFKEQQRQIEALQSANAHLSARLHAIENTCVSNSAAADQIASQAVPGG